MIALLHPEAVLNTTLTHGQIHIQRAANAAQTLPIHQVRRASWSQFLLHILCAHGYLDNMQLMQSCMHADTTYDSQYRTQEFLTVHEIMVRYTRSFPNACQKLLSKLAVTCLYLLVQEIQYKCALTKLHALWSALSLSS